MALCTDTFAQSWIVAVRLLFKPFRLIFWMKMAFIVFFAQVLFSQYLLFLKRFNLIVKPGARPDSLMEALPEIIAFLTGMILILIVFSLINAVTKVLFYDAILQGESYCRMALNRHHSTIVSFYIWSIIAPFIAIVIALIALFISLLFYGLTAVLLAILQNILTIFVMGFGYFALILLIFSFIIFYWTVMNGLVLPLMVTADLRFLAAFKKSLRLMAFHLSGVIGYAFIRSIFLLIKFIILIVMNLIVMFAIAGFSFQGMFEGQEAMSQNLTWISYMNPIGYFLCLILLPITILYDCYSLSFIAALTDGDDTSSPESNESISSDSPTPSAALPSDAPPSPPDV